MKQKTFLQTVLCVRLPLWFGAQQERQQYDEYMSILDEVSDLKAIVDYFRHQSNVDNKRIVLIGERWDIASLRKLHVIQGAGHGFKPEEFKEEEEQLEKFLKK